MNFFKTFIFFVVVILSSCDNKPNSSHSEKEIDSLLSIIDEQRKDIFNTDNAMNQMASTLDSIAKYESILIKNTEGTTTKATAIKNLMRFQEILGIYKERMVALHDSLSSSEKSNKSLLIIIDRLNAQITGKEKQIASLKSEISNGKREIRSLKANITQLTEANGELTATNTVLNKVASTQDKIINRGYFIVDTKTNLKKMGILSGGGLFSKSKVNTSNMNDGHFVSVDIRVTKEITVSGKSPKVLSQMPSGSYHWNGSKLIIDDPTSFWRITNYLIIQVK